MDRVRIDKWLWAARFFKTRALATKACELGRITIQGQHVKASRDARVGDMLAITNGSGDFQVQVLALSDQRGPAPIAQALYSETEESKQLRQAAAQQRKAMPFFEPIHEGRPSKRDRREYDRMRSRF